MWWAFRRSEKDECSKARALFPDYIDRRLNTEETAHVEGHLRACLGCREELESLRATVSLLRCLPEVTPARSFAVAPARPVPGRRALPALRFATAGVVLLLVLAFAADQTNLFQRGDPSTLSFGPALTSEGEEAYWTVPGVRNSVDPASETPETPVNLVVPDGSDNVAAAVNSLATGGVVYGTIESDQVVLTEGENGTSARGDAETFAILSESGDTQKSLASNDATVARAFYSVIEEQEGLYLNMLSSDNNVLYSFDLNDFERVATAAADNDWLRPLEYGLIGLVGVLGGVTAVLWLRQRRARAVEVSRSMN